MTTALINEVVTKYLYANGVPSNLTSDSLIRTSGATGSPVSINVIDFMQTGGGRFAKASEFEIVSKFFNSANALTLNHQYSLSELQGVLGSGGTTKSLQQYDYRDGTGDYFERTFVFNNTTYNIVDSANLKFIVDANGARYISGLQIAPQADNFDFTGAGASASLNNVIKPYIDPWNIGRTIDLNFTGTAPVISYTNDQYLVDSAYVFEAKALAAVSAKAALALEFESAANDLWNTGITKFIDTADDGYRPIAYGRKHH